MIKKLNLLQQNLNGLEGEAMCNALNNAPAQCCNIYQAINIRTSIS